MLRDAFPSARIRWLINTEWMPLLQGHPHIDEVLEFPRRQFRGASTILRVARWSRHLRDRVRPDLILDYQGLLRSALIARFCRHKDARLIGLSDAREGSRLFYDEVADTGGCEHAVERYLALTRTATGRSDSSCPEWILPTGRKPDGFDDSQPYVLLHPFARGAGKSLSLEDVTAFCRGMDSARVVLVGRTKQAPPATSNAINLLNRTDLLELIWLIRNARFTVSVDSGPMHIAAALTDRLVSIHTWSDPAKVGPYRSGAWVLHQSRLFRQEERSMPERHREVANIASLAEFVRSQL